MNEPRVICHQISHHILAIRDPQRSLSFYQQIMGMTLVGTRSCANRTHYLLGFGATSSATRQLIPEPPHCLLELVFDQGRRDPDQVSADDKIGYWKIALAVADLQLARAKLIAQDIEVSEPVQVPDVAYLCHCEDPDGYCIELIQHRFQKNHVAQAPDDDYLLDTMTSFSLITCRVKDPQKSIDFYQHRLGLRLVSKQVVSHRGFTLYFLSSDSEPAPSSDVEDIEMREWLWQRPYALLELQHIWGSEMDRDFSYNTDISTGFEGVRLLARNLSAAKNTSIDPVCDCESFELFDPDGYRIRVLKVD